MRHICISWDASAYMGHLKTHLRSFPKATHSLRMARRTPVAIATTDIDAVVGVGIAGALSWHVVRIHIASQVSCRCVLQTKGVRHLGEHYSTVHRVRVCGMNSNIWVCVENPTNKSAKHLHRIASTDPVIVVQSQKESGTFVSMTRVHVWIHQQHARTLCKRYEIYTHIETQKVLKSQNKRSAEPFDRELTQLETSMREHMHL